MNQAIENIRSARLYLLDEIKELSLEKLNKTPHGINNNILWNIGHLVGTLQGICYVRGGFPTPIPKEKFTAFLSGTKPERFYESDQVDEIKRLLIESVNILQRDYQDNLFTIYQTPWKNRYGTDIKNIDDAINFVVFHDAYHGGVVNTLKKLVQK